MILVKVGARVHVLNPVTDRSYCGKVDPQPGDPQWESNQFVVDGACLSCKRVIGDKTAGRSVVVLSRSMNGNVTIIVGESHVTMTDQQAIRLGGHLTRIGREAWKEASRDY